MRVTSSHTPSRTTLWKVGHTTKHLTLAAVVHSASFVLFYGTVCKMQSAAYSVEWVVHPSRTAKHTKITPIPCCALCPLPALSGIQCAKGRNEVGSMRFTQISISLFSRPQPDWSDEIEKLSITWKVNSVNGKPSYLILQSWHLQYTAQVSSLVQHIKSNMQQAESSVEKVFHLELILDHHLYA